MRRCSNLIFTAVAAALIATAPASAQRAHGVAAQTKRTAELNVMRAVPHFRGRHRLPELIDAHTGLLRNNVRAICRGRGARYGKRAFARFVCVVRPWPAAGKRELVVTYRSMSSRRYRVRWLRTRPHA